MPEIHIVTTLILFATGMVAGTIDAIAGGGGLISVPVLLSLGMPPHLVLGTNKLQSSIGTSIATYSYYQRGWLSFKKAYQGLLFGMVGAASGAWASQMISADSLKKIIPVLLLGILIYTLFSPKLADADRQPKIKEYLFFSFFGFVLGFYDGFFGPGTGSLWVFALTFFLGFHLMKATAYTKLFNLNSNIISLLCFVWSGCVDYRYGLCMAAGQLFGGRLGAHLTITKGAKLIRPVFLTVVTATIMSLVYKNYLQSQPVAVAHMTFSEKNLRPNTLPGGLYSQTK